MYMHMQAADRGQMSFALQAVEYTYAHLCGALCCVQALTGKPLTVYGDGTQTRSFQVRQAHDSRSTSYAQDTSYCAQTQHLAPLV